MEQTNTAIGRQPIINSDKIIIGYEIQFRETDENSENLINNVSATASILENILEIGLDSLIGNKLGFINIDPFILTKGVMDIFPENKIVLEIPEDGKINDKTILAVKDLRNKGFRFCAKGFNTTVGWESILKLSSYLKLDTNQYSKTEIEEIPILLKNYKRKLKFITENVETEEDFRYYKNMDFELFQGYFFEKPSVISFNRIDPDYPLLLKIFNSVQSAADIAVIEKLFRSSPGIVFKLLKVINSVIYDFALEISSVRQAIVLLGYEHIARWILTLIFAADKRKTEFDPLMESGIIKGRMMEEICNNFISKKLADKAFLIGMISAVNTFLNVPLAEFLKEIRVHKIIQEALAEHKGELGKLVTFMELYNAKDYQNAAIVLGEIDSYATMDEILSIESKSIIYLESIKKTIS